MELLIVVLVVLGIAGLLILGALVYGSLKLIQTFIQAPKKWINSRLTMLEDKEQFALMKVKREGSDLHLIEKAEEKRFLALRNPSLGTLREYENAVNALERKTQESLPPRPEV